MGPTSLGFGSSVSAPWCRVSMPGQRPRSRRLPAGTRGQIWVHPCCPACFCTLPALDFASALPPAHPLEVWFSSRWRWPQGERQAPRALPWSLSPLHTGLPLLGPGLAVGFRGKERTSRRARAVKTGVASGRTTCSQAGGSRQGWAHSQEGVQVTRARDGPPAHALVQGSDPSVPLQGTRGPPSRGGCWSSHLV